MKNDTYYLFCILGGLNRLSRVPKQIFLEKDIKMAKLYFRGYIECDKNPESYLLYKIGKMNKKMEFIPEKAYITGGFEALEMNKYERKTINQLNLLNEEKEIIEKASKENDLKNEIEILFGGNRIA